MSGWTRESTSTQLCSLRHPQSPCSHICHQLHREPLGSLFIPLFSASLTAPGGTRPFSRCGVTDSRSITPVDGSCEQLASAPEQQQTSLRLSPSPERVRHCCLAAYAAVGKQPRGGESMTASHPFPYFYCHRLCEKQTCCLGTTPWSQFCLPSSAELQGGQKRTRLHSQLVTTRRKQTTGAASPECNPDKAYNS